MAAGRCLFHAGLRDLALLLRGDAVLNAGMRPYGFHAGNKLPIPACPYLLTHEVAQRGVRPMFRYVLILNDWESDTQCHEV